MYTHESTSLMTQFSSDMFQRGYSLFIIVKYSKIWKFFSINLSEQSVSLFSGCTMQGKSPLESVNIVQNSVQQGFRSFVLMLPSHIFRSFSYPFPNQLEALAWRHIAKTRSRAWKDCYRLTTRCRLYPGK